jgi:hypothetical protein
MKFLRAPLLAALALFAAVGCGRDGNLPAAVVTVLVAPDGWTLAASETLTLTLTVRDRAGEIPTTRMGAVAWSSDRPDVAAVASDGTVTGVAPGEAVIRAEVDGVKGSARVRVAAAPPHCGEAGAVRSMAVGEARVVSGIEASVFCLDGGAGGKEYLLVPYYAGDAGSARLAVQVEAQGTVPPLEDARPALESSAPAADAGPLPDAEFHARLRDRAERELAPLVPSALAAAGRVRGAPGSIPGPSWALNLSAPMAGQEANVNVSTAACGTPDLRRGRVAAVGEHVVILADLTNPAGGFTDADYAAFAATFDTLVHPVVTSHFGTPSDVDRNRRVVAFYTRAVNELSPRGVTSYVAGFFHSRDLFPAQGGNGLQGCEGSNYAELIYMLVPDPNGTVNGNRFRREVLAPQTVSTLAHEYQHLINASRRLYERRTTHWNEERWLNEGLSHLAEELVFHRASGLAAGQNLGRPQVDASARTSAAYAAYMQQNASRLSQYLADPSVRGPYHGNDDLATRGSAWAFLRYALDRRGGDAAAPLRRLAEANLTGFANLQNVWGEDVRGWVRDWAVAVYADDHVPAVEARFTQPSWNFRSIYGSGFPLSPRVVSPLTATGLQIEAGSAAHLRLGVAAGGTGAVRVTSGGARPPPALFVTVVRVR